MQNAAKRSSDKSTLTPHAAEIDQLVQFIRSRDIRSARRMLVVLMGKGERIRQDIVAAYARLEHE